VPVVATEAGGVPEIVVDNETGLLAPVGGPHVIAEKVAAVLTDDNLRKRLINNASAYVKNFDKNVIVKKTLEIYEEVVK
jgi:glycosyltransferase involved in cell wall biosynthesis